MSIKNRMIKILNKFISFLEGKKPAKEKIDEYSPPPEEILNNPELLLRFLLGLDLQGNIQVSTLEESMHLTYVFAKSKTIQDEESRIYDGVSLELGELPYKEFLLLKAENKKLDEELLKRQTGNINI